MSATAGAPSHLLLRGTKVMSSIRTRAAESYSSERGQTAIIFAFVVTAVLGICSLVIDLGIAYQEEAELQAISDSAALAGSQELPNDPEGAVETAEEYIQAHGVDLDSDEYEITITTPYEGDETLMEVRIEHAVGFFLGPIVGVNGADANGRAVAGGSAEIGFGNFMPWAVKESAIKLDGTPTVMKYDSNTHQNGNYGPLDFGSGSSSYETAIKFGVQEPVCAQSQPTCTDPTEYTLTGNKIGATRDGVAYRLSNTVSTCDTFAEAVAGSAGAYTIKDACNPFLGVEGSKRVIIVPVIDNFCNGHCQVTLKYFALLFLNTLDTCKGNECQVTGTFIKKVFDPVSEYGYTPGGDVTVGSPGLVE
jgi:hypothetical protein